MNAYGYLIEALEREYDKEKAKEYLPVIAAVLDARLANACHEVNRSRGGCNHAIQSTPHSQCQLEAELMRRRLLSGEDEW